MLGKKEECIMQNNNTLMEQWAKNATYTVLEGGKKSQTVKGIQNNED